MDVTPIFTGEEKIQRKLDCLIKVIMQLISDRSTNQNHALKKKLEFHTILSLLFKFKSHHPISPVRTVARKMEAVPLPVGV